jgi:hypothetical protein
MILKPFEWAAQRALVRKYQARWPIWEGQEDTVVLLGLMDYPAKLAEQTSDR